ncbi:ribosomal oxygenase 1-like [Littorina saxatilis]|uniref:Bifunctional lysine-specific demethylase and histidyl-hydroxylase n=1 Tax=Littorina saxatilis TaxID=31220 RepID=A0AAN9BDN4_9CAEN
MKKSSAFSVFAGKGNERKAKKMDTPTGPKEAGGSLKRAGSTPTMGRGKKLLNSIRASVRGSGQKGRPPNLKNKEESPHIASNTARQVSLTSLKSVGDEAKAGSKAKQGNKPAVDHTSKPTSQSNLKSVIPVRAEATSSQPAVGSKIRKQPASFSTFKLPASAQNDATETNGKGTKRQLELQGSTVAAPKSKKKRVSSETGSVSGEDIGHSRRTRRKLTDSGDGETETNEKLSKQVPYMHDSSAEAARMFDVLIHPVTTDRFFRELWEQKPLLVRRHLPDYNKGWFSTAEFDRILRQENIQFGVNIDITSYVDDKRETHNPAGRAYAPLVWDFYQKGCSVRFLNPQSYCRSMWKILSVIQEFFNCSVGANVYLTPPGTQGFAPHYDDIEAFVIQLEGKKHWKLYNPRSDEETLPRFSSKNFSQNDIGGTILDVVLEAGDLLYFPRGTIHQASADENEHSLHVTFSCYQRNTWGDILEKLVPQALAMAIEENIEFRRGLPHDFLSYMGIVHQDKESTEREQFQSKVESLVKSLVDHLPLDAACDQMGKQAIHDALPPVLTEHEKSCTIHGGGERWDAEEKVVRGVVELEPDTHVRIIRKGVLRMLTEEDEVRIYHTLENSRVYHGSDPQYIEISSEMAPAVEYLIDVYPEYVPIDGLPLDTLQEKLDVASTLYDKGLLMTEKSLQTMYDEGTDSEEENKQS